MTFRGPVSRLRNLCLGCGVWGLGRGRLQGSVALHAKNA